MATSIEWTDTTWNPVRGCTRVSEGCRNCYAERMAARGLPGLKSPTTGEDFAVLRGDGPRWTGQVELIPHKLADPLRWRKPRRCFVNSMSDLFHEALSFEEISAVFGVMVACPHITFQVLTKRAGRAAEWFEWVSGRAWEESDPGVGLTAGEADICWYDMEDIHPNPASLPPNPIASWPLPNLWLGVSAENQETADERIPPLLQCPAAVRFVSYEPALGPINFKSISPNGPLEPDDRIDALTGHELLYVGPDGEGKAEWAAGKRGPRLNWVIAGGESGPSARPPHPDWFRRVRDDCVAAGVPFFFKQWGEWAPVGSRGEHCWNPGASIHDLITMDRIGKRKAGRLLDGREWSEFPKGGGK